MDLAFSFSSSTTERFLLFFIFFLFFLLIFLRFLHSPLLLFDTLSDDLEDS